MDDNSCITKKAKKSAPIFRKSWNLEKSKYNEAKKVGVAQQIVSLSAESESTQDLQL